jgi:hypothetical protein
MTVRAGVLMLAGLLMLTGCTAVTVQVPPEVDLQAVGIKTVAIAAADLPNDTSPVGTLLRAETAQKIRTLLPALDLVEDGNDADAVLRMEVASHAVGPAYFQTTRDSESHRVSCEAWQDAFLIVNASVLTRGNSTPAWESLLQDRSRIDLSCTPFIGPIGAVRSPAASDPQLVGGIVRQLGMKLAGYTRTELRRR